MNDEYANYGDWKWDYDHIPQEAIDVLEGKRPPKEIDDPILRNLLEEFGTTETESDVVVPCPAEPEPVKGDTTEDDKLLRELEEALDLCAQVHGLIWDPMTSTNIELTNISDQKTEADGSWKANFDGSDGHSYMLVRLPSKPTGTAEKSQKIGWAPVHQNGIDEFSQKAWPKSGEPASSGVGQDRSVIPANGEMEEERLKYPDQPSKTLWLGVVCAREFGNKPSSNEKPLPLETLTGMTLKEHMTHVSWYSSTSDFKAKIHPEVLQQLWEEMVEIYKMVNIYNIKKPEPVLILLRSHWARKYYGKIQSYTFFI